jgi:hypothetical protein
MSVADADIENRFQSRFCNVMTQFILFELIQMSSILPRLQE